MLQRYFAAQTRPIRNEDLPGHICPRELRSLSVPVELKPYDSTWPEQYELEEEVIKRVLGAAVSEIAHVGSTSISRNVGQAGHRYRRNSLRARLFFFFR
jgi:hypothetical protein